MRAWLYILFLTLALSARAATGPGGGSSSASTGQPASPVLTNLSATASNNANYATWAATTPGSNAVANLNGKATNVTVWTNIFLGSNSVLTNNDATTNVYMGPMSRAGGIYLGPDGNVGIGTNNATGPLIVKGTTEDVRIEPSGQLTLGTLSARATLLFNNRFQIAAANGTGLSSGGLRIMASGSDPGNVNAGRMIVDTDLGIGTTSPLQSETISNTSATAIDSFAVYSSNNPTPAFLVKSNGNVGIGTATPSAGFHAAGTAQIDGILTLGNNVNIVNAFTLAANNSTWRTAGAFRFTINPANSIKLSSVLPMTWSGTDDSTATTFDTSIWRYGAGTNIFGGATNTVTGVILIGGLGIGTTSPRQLLEVAGGILISNTGGGLRIGAGNASLTNILYASATLDFPSTAAGAVSDLPITVTGASDGDIVSLGVPSAQLTGLTGDYFAWASNGVVYVRFANNNLVSAQDPASGTFRVKVEKFQ